MKGHRRLGSFIIVALSVLIPGPRSIGAEEQNTVGRSSHPFMVIGKNAVYLVAPDGESPLATVDIGQPVDGVVFSPDAARIYVFSSGRVGGSGGASRPAKLDLIGATSLRVEGSMELGRSPASTLLTRDGGTLLVLKSEPGQGSVMIVDAKSLSVVSVVPVHPNPIGMVLSDDERRLFVAAAGDKRAMTPELGPALAIVELATRSLRSTTPLGGAPRQLVVSGGFIYVLCEQKSGAEVRVFDGGKGDAVAALPVPRTELPLVRNPTKPILYLGAGSNVFVFENGRQLASHALDKPVVRLEVATDGSRVVAGTSRTTYVLDEAGRKLKGTIAAGIRKGCVDCRFTLSPNATRTIITWPMDATMKILDNDALKVIVESDKFGKKSMTTAAALGVAMGAAGTQVGGAGWSLTFTPQLGTPSAEDWIAFRDDGRFAVAANAATGDVCTFDLDAGSRLGIVNLNGAHSALATGEGSLVFGIGESDLIAVDPKTGKERVNSWQQAVTGAQRHANGTQVLVFKRDRIEVLDAALGRKVRSILNVIEPRAVVFPPSAREGSS